jgi:hypothetical protein
VQGNQTNDGHLHALTIDVLEGLFALVRQTALRSADPEPLTQSVLGLHRALVAAHPPFTLQLLPDAVLRDRVALPLTLEQFRRCQQLSGACARWGVHELSVEHVPAKDVLLAFAEALFKATNTSAAARAPRLPGLHLRALRRVGDSPPPPEAFVDQYLAEQLGRVCAATEQVTAHSARLATWPWQAVQALQWRLERCMAAGVTASARSLELEPPPWSTARSAVAAAFYVGAVLSRLQVSPLSQRAATQAMLAIATHGLGDHGGAPLHEAAGRALGAVLAPPTEASGQPQEDPHRLRVATLVHAAARATAASAAPLSPLLHAVYELERRRRGAEGGPWLSRLDLHAWLASALGQELHPQWGRALLGVLGLIPVGSHVLADGRLGVVIAASDKGDPWRPRVLVGGQVAVPEQPVRPCSPLGMTS